eukprot:87411-Pelagomonas_calceolata.AAC.8
MQTSAEEAAVAEARAAAVRERAAASDGAGEVKRAGALQHVTVRGRIFGVGRVVGMLIAERASESHG